MSKEQRIIYLCYVSLLLISSVAAQVAILWGLHYLFTEVF